MIKLHNKNLKYKNRRFFTLTHTAGHEFDVSFVEAPRLVAGLTANCDLLRRVEGHLAPHLADLTCLIIGHICLDAQHLWLWYQWLPQCCLVATSAEIKSEGKIFSVCLGHPPSVTVQ